MVQPSNEHSATPSCLSGVPGFGAEEVFYAARASGASVDEAKELVDERWRTRGAFPPITLMELFLTDACNLACPYCFVQEKWQHRIMSLETMQDAVRFLVRESRDVKDVSIVLMGGEPTLQYGVLQQFVPWAHAQAALQGKRIRFDMTSNGTLIDDEKARFFKQQRVMVLLSIDGDKSTHDRHRPTKGGKGSFDRVLTGLQALKRHQGYVGAKMTIVQDQVPHLLANVAALAGHGVDFFMMGHATGGEWGSADAEALARAYVDVYEWWAQADPKTRPKIRMIEEAVGEKGGGKRHAYGCRAGRTGLVVTPERDLFPCSKMLGANDSKGILQLGTLDTGLVAVETRKKLNGYGAFDRPACWNCRMQSKCMGGCYAVNHTLTGDPFTPGADCRVVAFVQWAKEEIQRRHRVRIAASSASAHSTTQSSLAAKHA